VILGAETNTMILPRAAVFEENGGAFVYVQGPEGWTKKQVEPG